MIALDHLGTKVWLSPDGRVHVDGRDMQLDPQTTRRLFLALEPDRLRNLGSSVGIGDQQSTISIADAVLVIKHKGDRKSVARSVRGTIDLLIGLAEVVRGQTPYESWVKQLPIPIETENLVVRFHTYEPRNHEKHERDRWTSIFANGTVLKFDDATTTLRGTPAGTMMLPPQTVTRIATLVAQIPLPRSADATIEDDEDRRITMEVQRLVPRTGELLLGLFAWSYWAGAAELCRARIDQTYARGEHELVYALYTELVPIR